MFALIGSVDVSLITQPTLQKMVYLSVVMAYLITTKPTLLYSFVSPFLHSNFIISVDIIVVSLVWLSSLSRSLSSSVCLTISFRLLSQLHRKADLHGMALCVRLVFSCSLVSVVACVHKRPSFSIHSSSCLRRTAALLPGKFMFQLVCQRQPNYLAAPCLAISIRPLLPIRRLELPHVKLQSFQDPVIV